MEILNILIKVQKKFKNKKRWTGLCNAAAHSLNEEDLEIFQEYFKKSKSHQKVWFTHIGKEVNDNTQFAWIRYLRPPRLSWLITHIKKNQLIKL